MTNVICGETYKSLGIECGFDYIRNDNTKTFNKLMKCDMIVFSDVTNLTCLLQASGFTALLQTKHLNVM